MTSSRLKPSTVDSGFRLQPAPLENPVTTDPYFQRVIRWYLSPEVEKAILLPLNRFGEEAVSDGVHTWIANAEREQPYVKQYNVWGQRYPYDKLITAEGWKKLGEWGTKNGYVFSTSVSCTHV
jgi:hypothetical protein